MPHAAVAPLFTRFLIEEMPPNRAAALLRMDRLAALLDGKFRVPGFGTFGYDALIGLIPVAGDILTGFISLHIANEARRVGAGRSLIIRMLCNIGLDVAVGAIPILGDALDFAFRVNRRNLALLRRHLERADPRR